MSTSPRYRNYDIRELTIGNVLAAKAQLHGDRVFLRYLPDGRTFSYRDIDRLSNRLANGLLAWGIARGRTAPSSLEALGLRVYSALAPAAGRTLRGRGIASRFALGALWGLTPCALVYGVLPLALLSGGAWQGALIMLAFGVGTLPNLLAAGGAARNDCVGIGRRARRLKPGSRRRTRWRGIP